MILPSSRPSGDRPQPWPAAPVQLAVKLKSLPAHHKARGARGTVFQPPGILLYSFQARSLPQPWSERKSRGNGAQHPEVGSPPAYKERLTPSAPAGSPPQTAAAGTACWQALQQRVTAPGLAPSCSPGLRFPALTGTAQGSAGLHHSPQCCAIEREDSQGQTCHSPTTVPRFPRTAAAPAALPFSVFIVHQHTDSKPREETTLHLSLLPASPRSCPLNRKISSSLRQSTFSSFCSTCCCTKAVLPTKQTSLSAEHAVSNQPACQELS